MKKVANVYLTVTIKAENQMEIEYPDEKWYN